MIAVLCRAAQRCCVVLLVVAATIGAPQVLAGEPGRRTENVIVVTIDGFRWQEFFSGADESLFDKKLGGVGDPKALKTRYWDETPHKRREFILPFIWGTAA